MGIVKVTITKSLNGRSNRDTFKNDYFIRTNFILESPEMLANIRALVDAEKVGFPTSVYFMQAHAKQLAENAVNRPSDYFRTEELDDRGLRVFASPPMPANICLAVKRSAAYGRAGKLLYRHMVEEDEVSVSANNTFTLDAPEVFTTGGFGADTLIEKLNAGVPKGTLCLPDKAYFFVQTSRDVTGHRLGGLVSRQKNQQRRSIGQDETNIAQRRLNEFGRQVGALVKALTGSDDAASILSLIASIALEAFTFWQSLPTPLRSRLRVPARLKGRAGF
jgi:hypothetical protein